MFLILPSLVTPFIRYNNRISPLFQMTGTFIIISQMLGVLDSSFWIKLSVILKYPFVLQSSHGSQGFCLRRAPVRRHTACTTRLASVVHTFEAVAKLGVSERSSSELGGAQSEIKIAKNTGGLSLRFGDVEVFFLQSNVL